MRNVAVTRKLHLFDVDTMGQTLGAIEKTGVSSQVLITALQRGSSTWNTKFERSIGTQSCWLGHDLLASFKRVTASSSIS